ncbi:ATP-binding protein [Sphingobacterium sp. JB170]|uniref:ATP-binding protein n=1 Tax=Sphingobacterium sp. JB170 TaxID=1434842 RepID=UPI00097EE5BA|nr:ATP-binding protein [Sphingobacterium sp. JB170]SJN27767.1 hypothetical protein FM107_05445 [Sphingobacterium sp. JB170]
MLQNTTPDAAESSAGDDFHILWAVQKSLKLINFDPKGLKSVAVENLSNQDTSYLDTSGGMSLGVDLTEYYGGRCFADSEEVVVSQLKYSTRSPEKDWTPARICTSSKGGPEGSIIERLASFYLKLSDQVDRGVVLSKLKIKLVSNRPAAKKLTTLIGAVKDYSILQYPKIVDLPDLYTILDSKQQKELTRLLNASNLTSSKFVDFINVLDFSDCDVGSRFELEQKIIAAISSFTSFRTSFEYTYLHKLIWGKMMPEQRAINTITLPDVLYAFGLHDISAIFPVKNEILKPENVVLREQLSAIRAELLNEDNKLICLHGKAGIGKSTLVNMIPDILPEHSVTVIFDCYGGGSYLDPDDRRHKHATGIVQLCNELSLKAGSNLLLTFNGTDEFFLKQLKERVRDALEVIRVLNPEAILAIILDAADNSITATNLFEDKPFVKDLVNMEFPQGCKIIVSARTERVTTLELPNVTKQIRLEPFSYDETVTFLADYFQDASEEQIKEFRRLTHAIPRVMAYALELPGKNLTDKMIPLKPKGKTLEQIFRLRVKEAERKSSKNDVTAFLKNLIALPRPVPLDFIKHTTTLSEESIGDIRIDLWREVSENHQEFTFRDEDFETYLRKTYQLGKEDYVKIASVFLLRADEDEYASTHLANFLSKAEMYDVLREIVIEKKHLSCPLDPIKNKEVFIDRARTAMRNASMNFNPQNFAKLLVVSAEAAKTNKVLEDILFGHPELAAQYGNLQTTQKIYFQSGNPGWFGPVHYRNAAIYARQPETRDLAKLHLQKAKEWVEYRKKLNKEDLEDYRLKASDLAYGAEAIFHLSGADRAVDWIKGWKPKKNLYSVAELWLKNLIKTDRITSAERWLKKNGNDLRIDTRLLVVQIYFLNGLKPPLDIDKMLKDIVIFSRSGTKKGDKLLGAIMAFCEYCLKTGINYENVKPALSLIQLGVPTHPPGFYSDDTSKLIQLDMLLRKGIILKLFEGSSFESKDFYPKKLQESYASDDYKVKSQVEDQVKRFERIYSHLLPAYEIRANYFFKKNLSITHVKSIENQLKILTNDWELNYYQKYDATALHKFILLKLLDIVFHQSGDGLVNLIKKQIVNGLKDIDILISVCEKLSQKKRFKDSVEFIMGHIEGMIDRAKLSGREIVDYYTRAAVTGSICSLDTGKYFFDKMVEASSEIDLEAFDQIRSIRDLAEQIPPLQNPELAIKFFRYAEYCAERLRSWDGFPWHVLIPTLARLDTGSAFMGICQWDHRYVQATDGHYMELISAALEQDFISVDIAIAMLAMNRYYYDGLSSYYKLLFAKIDEKKDYKLKNEALRQIIRDIKFHWSSKKNTVFLKDFLNLFKNGKFTDKNIIKDFESYIDELERIILIPASNDSIEGVKKQKIESYQRFISKQKTLDADILNNIIQDIRTEIGGDYINYSQLFEDIATNTTEQYYSVYLDALISVGDQGVSYYDFECGLETFLTAWMKNKKVKEWRLSAFEKIVQRWFTIFFDDNYVSYESLKRLAKILEINDGEFALSLIKIIPEELDDLSSRALYQMLTIVYPLITVDKCPEILSWILSRWIERVPEDYTTTDIKGILTDGTPIDVVAHFIRYNLGHPKKKIRWITAHILRRLAKLGNSNVLKALLDLQNEHTCHPFQDQSNTFYWISAKLYLWIAIARISQETPEIILSLSSYLIAEMRNNELPHAQIKYFAQSAAVAIIKHDREAFSTEEIEEIEKALFSPFDVVIVDRAEYSSDKEQTDLRFKFDVLDSLPGWYEPLGRLFKVGPYAVAEIADKFISEHWGYIGDVQKDDHIQDSDYGNTNNRHGSEPSIENLRSYYEYHAMFCAATILLQTNPLIVERDNWRETWEEWLGDWGLCWKDFWLSDFNEPTPLLKKYWVNSQEGKRDWEWDIQHKDFDEILGLEDQETIVVHLGSTVHIGKDYEELSLGSGLVSPVTGNALMRLFQTQSAYDNHIPLEKETQDDYEDRSFKDSFPQFKLTGWLLEEKTDIDGLDDLDPLYKNLSKARIRPGSLFCEWSGCKFSEDFKFSIRKNSESEDWLTQFFSWSNLKDKDSYSDFTTGGVMLLAKRKELKYFLNHLGMDLIVKATIGRKVKREDYTYYPPYSKIYLFKSNGKIETITGDNLTW